MPTPHPIQVASILHKKLQFTCQPQDCPIPVVISFLFFPGFYSNSLQRSPFRGPFPFKSCLLPLPPLGNPPCTTPTLRPWPWS